MGSWDLREGIKRGLDTAFVAGVLSWSLLASLADTAFDLLSGRRVPEPDMKSVAEAPEPGAINRLRPPKSIPRPTRPVRDEAA